MLKTWRILWSAYGWRTWLFGWTLWLVLYLIVFGLGFHLMAPHRPSLTLLLLLGGIGALLGGFGTRWLPVADFVKAGSRTEFLVCRFVSRPRLFLFWALRSLVPALGVIALALALIGVAGPAFKEGVEREPALRFVGLVSFAVFLLPTALGLIGRTPWLGRFLPSGSPFLLLVVIFLLVSNIKPLRAFVAGSLEGLGLFGPGAWLGIIAGLLGLSWLGFASAEFGATSGDGGAPLFGRRRSSATRWRPASYDPARAFRRHFLGRIPAVLIVMGFALWIFMKDGKNLGPHPWDGTPWHYLGLGLLVGFVCRGVHGVTEREAEFLYMKGLDLGIIARERMIAEFRAGPLIVAVMGLLMLLILPGPAVVEWTLAILLAAAWTIFVFRSPSKKMACFTLMMMGWVVALDGLWQHATIAIIMASSALLAAWNYFGMLRDPDALRLCYLPQPRSPEAGGAIEEFENRKKEIQRRRAAG